jgi:cell division protein FtsW
MFPVVAGAVLILIEPDLGTASVVGVLAVAMLWMANLNKRILRRIGVLAVLGAIGDMVWHPYQIGRLTAFLRPHWSLQGKNYQKLLSLRGLGAGGWAGLGLGHSKMKWGWLPNAHTDFIFTIIGEELGLIGTLVVLGLFVAWIIITARIVANCKNEAYRLVGTGIMVWIAFEALINILSVMGWWAVVGIPLPFFSYGGTSLIVDLAAMGLLYNIANSSDRALEVSIENHYVPTLQELRESRRVVASPRPREF